MNKALKKHPLEQKVGRALLGKGWSLALAESCTGGLVGCRITAVPGSSRYFRGGIVAYDNRVKHRSLGVRPATLKEHGAVSAETAVEMAAGARRALETKVALAVTGIAGPGGGTRDKPVGLVFAAVSAGRKTEWAVGNFKGGRDEIRRRGADMALELLYTFIRKHG